MNKHSHITAFIFVGNGGGTSDANGVAGLTGLVSISRNESSLGDFFNEIVST